MFSGLPNQSSINYGLSCIVTRRRSLTSQKLYSNISSGGSVFSNVIFDLTGIFQPSGVVTRAIHCWKKVLWKNTEIGIGIEIETRIA